MNRTEFSLPKVGGGRSDVLMRKDRYEALVQRMHIRGSLTEYDKQQLKRRVLTAPYSIAVKSESTVGALTSTVLGSERGSYTPSTGRIVIKKTRVGTRRRKERILNRALVHETMHATDKEHGIMDKPISRGLTILSNLGNLALNAWLITKAGEAFGNPPQVVKTFGDVAFCTGLAGIVAYRINPIERRARAAEKVYYDPDYPIVTIADEQNVQEEDEVSAAIAQASQALSTFQKRSS